MFVFFSTKSRVQVAEFQQPWNNPSIIEWYFQISSLFSYKEKQTRRLKLPLIPFQSLFLHQTLNTLISNAIMVRAHIHTHALNHFSGPDCNNTNIFIVFIVGYQIEQPWLTLGCLKINRSLAVSARLAVILIKSSGRSSWFVLSVGKRQAV